MAEALNSLGNRLVSDRQIVLKPNGIQFESETEESIVGTNATPSAIPEASRRRRGNDEEDTDLYDDDDMESLISQPVNGINGNNTTKPEEEVELPPHACA